MEFNKCQEDRIKYIIKLSKDIIIHKSFRLDLHV